MTDIKLINNPEFQRKVEKNLGRPVLALLELPMDEAEKQAIEKLGLKEGDIVSSLEMDGAIGAHTWSCSVSFPPDCSVDLDG